MSSYYFNVHDGKSLRDHDGVDLPDRQAAWGAAVYACGEILKDVDGDMAPESEWRMEVTDDVGSPVFTLRFCTTDHT